MENISPGLSYSPQYKFLHASVSHPLLAGHYQTYDSPTKLVLRRAAIVSFKIFFRKGRRDSNGMEISTEKSKTMTNSANNMGAHNVYVLIALMVQLKTLFHIVAGY